jgi:hypothetical protein
MIALLTAFFLYHGDADWWWWVLWTMFLIGELNRLVRNS